MSASTRKGESRPCVLVLLGRRFSFERIALQSERFDCIIIRISTNMTNMDVFTQRYPCQNMYSMYCIPADVDSIVAFIWLMLMINKKNTHYRSIGSTHTWSVWILSISSTIFSHFLWMVFRVKISRHCASGISRSVAVCTAWIMLRQVGGTRKGLLGPSMVSIISRPTSYMLILFSSCMRYRIIFNVIHIYTLYGVYGIV